jgi:CBS-domain-containing membrane protein
MKNYFEKMRGTKESPPRVRLSEVIWSSIGGFVGIASVGFLGSYQGLLGKSYLFLICSFGASAVLIYGAPQAIYAQPRNLIGGHVLSAAIGVTIFKVIPDPLFLSSALAVAATISIMHSTRTIHPPGGATALIAIIGGADIHNLGFIYVFSPVAIGACIMLLVALIVNNIPKNRKYPEYWV